MYNKNSWGAVCLLAIFSLAIHGCGGGSSSSVSEVPEMPVPTPTTEQQATADKAVMEATDAAAEATTAATTATDAVSAATLADTMAASDAAMAATTAATAATTAAGAVDALDPATVTAADTAAMAATAAAVTARMAASDLIMAEKDAIDEAQDKRIAAAKQAKIMGLTVAIDGPDEDGRHTKNVIGAKAGGVIKYLDDTLGIDDKTPDGDSVEGQFGVPSEAMAITGWKGTTQSKTMDNVMTELVVYSDAGPVKSEKYLVYFSNDNTKGENRRPAEVDHLNDDGELKFDPGAVSNADSYEGSLFTFPLGATTVKTHPSDDSSTRAKEHEVEGTFAEVPGTFACGAAKSGCTVTGNSKGKLVSLGKDWTFRPTGTASNINVPNVQKDLNYLSFGYWLKTTTEADGSMTYSVNTFEDGSEKFDGTIKGLEGTATYNGNATGMYALKDFSTGAGVPSEAGQFTADAKLIANFGGDSVAKDDMFYISGTVTDFKNAYGANISNGAWMVNLNRGNKIFDSVEVSGSTTGGGSWEGTFYGNGMTKNDTPMGIVGGFDAHFGNGHVVGAFGATR